MSTLSDYLINFPTKGNFCSVFTPTSFHKQICPFPSYKVSCAECIFSYDQEDKHKAIVILGKLGE